jgi:hypothetical protein
MKASPKNLKNKKLPAICDWHYNLLVWFLGPKVKKFETLSIEVFILFNTNWFFFSKKNIGHTRIIFNFCDSCYFPYRMIVLLLILPVFTAISKQTLLVMNIVKARLYNKMKDDFLMNSLILYIERENTAALV